MFNKHNLSCLKIVSKSPHREALGSVFFQKGKTVATDSFRLLEVNTPKDDISDYPKFEGVTPLADFEPFMVSGKELKNIVLSKRVDLPILNNIVVKSLGGETVELFTTDLNNSKTHSFKVVTREEFPKYESIFPTKEPTVKLKVNAKMLGELLMVMSKMHPNNEVTVNVYDGNAPILIQGGTEEQEARGLLMPFRM